MTQSLEKMAQLCERQKLADKAAKYWEKFIQIVDQDGMVEEKSTGHTRAYIYLSRYYLDKKDFQNVELYAKKCLGLVQTREHGNQMLKIITEMSGKKTQLFQLIPAFWHSRFWFVNPCRTKFSIRAFLCNKDPYEIFRNST